MVLSLFSASCCSEAGRGRSRGTISSMESSNLFRDWSTSDGGTALPFPLLLPFAFEGIGRGGGGAITSMGGGSIDSPSGTIMALMHFPSKTCPHRIPHTFFSFFSISAACSNPSAFASNGSKQCAHTRISSISLLSSPSCGPKSYVQPGFGNPGCVILFS